MRLPGKPGYKMIQLPILKLPDLQVRHLCHIHLCGVDILILAGQKRLVFVQFNGNGHSTSIEWSKKRKMGKYRY